MKLNLDLSKIQDSYIRYIFRQVTDGFNALAKSNVSGVQGPQGPMGATGAQGPAGAKGDKGDKGDTGPQGPIGPQGVKGDTGAQGLQGPQGDVGPQGIKGDKGDQGDPGPQGITGDQGPIGPKGDTGPQGLQGPSGADGLNGTNGTNGIDGVNGSDGLSAYEVAVSNGYIGTEAQWLASLVGPQGIQGVQGEKGDVGPAGDQGPQGLPGETGPAGLDATWVHPRDGFRMIENFNAASPAGDLSWVLTTNSGQITINSSLATGGRTGIVSLSTVGVSTATPTLTLCGTNSNFVMGSLTHSFETDLRFGGGLATDTEVYIARIGYLATTTSASSLNGVWFEYDRSTYGDFWVLRTRNASSDTILTTTSPLTSSGVWHSLKIIINTTGTSAKFYVGGVFVGEITTNIPTGTTKATGPTYQIQKTAGTGTRNMHVDWSVICGGIAVVE